MRMRSAFFLIFCLLLSPPVFVLAQGADVPRVALSQLEGEWVILDETSGTATATDAEALAASAMYLGGPEGARATVVTLRVADSPASVRRLWDQSNELFDDLRVEFEADYSSERELAEFSGPSGCTDARRMTGTDSIATIIPVGVTLCAADPDLIVLAYASGEVNGLTGFRASDALVELVLRQDAEATPEAA